MRLATLILVLATLAGAQDSSSNTPSPSSASLSTGGTSSDSAPSSNGAPVAETAQPSGTGLSAPEYTPNASVVNAPTDAGEPVSGGNDTAPSDAAAEAASLTSATAAMSASPALVTNATTDPVTNATTPIGNTNQVPLPNAPNDGSVGHSDQNTPPGSDPGSAPGCDYCTIPNGYSNLDVPAPLNVQNQFTNSWQRAHAQAADRLQNWSLEDKVNLATGVGWMQGRCVGNTPAIPDKDWKGLCLQDSPLGPRFADRVTAMVSGINAAATFDKSLMYARGKVMGREFRGKGIHIALGPMTNMGRVAEGGRNWEGFGGDPYLSGLATQYTIWGIQDQGVQACVKHFIGNEQERNRTTSSSNLDDRTMREIYAHPFLRAVQADVASVMCSYNLVNGSWACQNPQTLNGIMKTDFGFGGYVMSDWNGQHSGVLSANTGLDMTMPGDIDMNGGQTTFWGPHLVEAVKNGSVPAARVDDMAERIMAAWYLLGQQEGFPDVNFNSWMADGPQNEHVDVQDNHARVVRQIGAASVVLLKNENNALPLKKPVSMAVIGSDMGPAQGGPNGCADHGCLDGTLAMGWGSGTSAFPYLVDPLQALVQRAKADHTSLSWWLHDWDTSGAVKIAQSADVAIVGIASDSGEGYITVDGNEGDRNNLTAWHNGDELVKAVAAVNKNTIVVVHSVGPMTVEPWIDHPNVTAVVWAGLPGQESGNSLVDVLYGAVNPSGRLPYTIAKQPEDYPTKITYVNSDMPKEPQVNYDEKLNIDYRHFLANSIAPRFGFGYGLSYSSFSYSNVAVGPHRDGHWKRGGPVGRRTPSFTDDLPTSLETRELTTVNDTLRPDSLDPENAKSNMAQGDTTMQSNGNQTKITGSGEDATVATFGEANGGWNQGRPPRIGAHNTGDLHQPRWTVSVQVSNTGGCDGYDVPQLYLAFPAGSGEPPRVFRDFERVFVRRGDSMTVRFDFSKYDVSIWDVVAQQWTVPSGTFSVIVAKNAFDGGVKADFTPSS